MEKKEVILLLKKILDEISAVEAEEGNKEKTSRNYFDGISDAELVIRQKIKELTN